MHVRTTSKLIIIYQTFDQQLTFEGRMFAVWSTLTLLSLLPIHVIHSFDSPRSIRYGAFGISALLPYNNHAVFLQLITYSSYPLC